ncbi:hypothetical protein SCLCIDRAFT_26189 [Scleroderma citrinum Foug A]|uniref:Uncharacterized protein n=1 Tax=Scleroderma citrinum Foug A TaxID=1036808 RepID=A0A0C2ZHA5_9AGAM|nr:hypothetical protein SCLCIDRAFT_26189 [Scleroderma citrinum Foug A]
MVDGGEVLELELGGLRSEPLEECNLVIMEIGALEDVEVPLTLLCVSRAPQVFPWTKHGFSFAICTHPEGELSGGTLCESDRGQRLQIAGLPLHRRRNYGVTMSQSPCRFEPLLNGR